MFLDLPMPRRPLMLAASLLVAGFVALSIHVAMLAAGTPFPVPRPPLWSRGLHEALVAGAMLVFLRLASDRIGDRSIPVRIVVAFFILAATQETLRVAIMTGIVTGGWAHAAIELVRPLIRILILSALCVIAVRWARNVPLLVVVALAVGAVSVIAQQRIDLTLAPVLQQFAGLARGDLYGFPYPFHVTLAAYLTFIEAVVGATLMVMLVWDSIPGAMATRLLMAALLVANLKGVMGKTFVYGFFTGSSAWLGVFSWSQFLLEFLTLGLLIGLAWATFGHRSPVASRVVA